MDKKDLFEESVSREHRISVLRNAREELRANRPTGFWSFALKAGTLAAGLGGLTWWGTKWMKPEVAPQQELDINQIAMVDMDPEMLENLDWLEDLELLESLDEIEGWEST